jgi:DNA uptake protein ComE-like DNA-binding protein
MLPDFIARHWPEREHPVTEVPVMLLDSLINDTRPVQQPPTDTQTREVTQRLAPGKKPVTRKTWKKDTFNLNRCDSTALQDVYGIGPAYASRIVKYRNLLGGYVSEEQLTEVYGLPDSTVSRVQHRVFIESGYTPEQLAINLASFREILRHPYFSYEQTKAVINHRNRYGAYGNVSHLEETGRTDFHPLLLYYLNFSQENRSAKKKPVK